MGSGIGRVPDDQWQARYSTQRYRATLACSTDRRASLHWPCASLGICRTDRSTASRARSCSSAQRPPASRQAGRMPQKSPAAPAYPRAQPKGTTGNPCGSRACPARFNALSTLCGHRARGGMDHEAARRAALAEAGPRASLSRARAHAADSGRASQHPAARAGDSTGRGGGRRPLVVPGTPGSGGSAVGRGLPVPRRRGGNAAPGQAARPVRGVQPVAGRCRQRRPALPRRR